MSSTTTMHADRTGDDGEAGSASDEPGQPPDRPPGATIDTRVHVEIDDRTGALARDRARWLRDCLGRAIGAAGAAGEVRVAVVGDESMAEAHERYCAERSTTDVITFDLRDRPGADAPLDTDLIVCHDEARRQAERRSVPVERELLLYCLHGVLHCLGHTDKTDEGFARMHEREDEILAAIGVGATFAPGDDNAGRPPENTA